MSHKLFPRVLESRKALVISIIFTLVALAVRLIGLSLDSLWYDEVFSIRAARLAWDDIIRLAISDVHSPLYLLLLHTWTRLFGETESSARMFSVCFSVLTVFVVYHLALKLFNSRGAFFAALFITFSPFHVFYAQETRMYSQLTFFTATSVYFFISWLKEDTRLSSALYVISTALLLYTHLYAAFVVMAQVFYFALLFLRGGETFTRRGRRWLILQVITASVFLPWALVGLQQATRARRGFWISPPDWLMPFRTLMEYCGSLGLTLLLLPLFIYGVKRCCEQSSEAKTSPPHLRAFLLLWLILPIGVPFLLSKLTTPFYSPKYTIAASLPFFLFAAWGLAQVRRVVWQMVLVLLICVGSGIELSRDLTTLKRERWRDAAYNIELAAQAGDLVLFNSPGTYLGFDYYAKRKDLSTAVFPYSATDEQVPNELTMLRRALAEGFGSIHPPQTEQETKDKLHKIVGDRRRVWVVTRYGGGGFKDDFTNAFQNAFRAAAQPPLCVSQRRLLFTETYGETSSAIFLQQRGLSCAAQVYLLER